jgi:hypothetical protein
MRARRRIGTVGSTMIDSHAHTFDVSTSHVVAVDAEPDAVLAGLDSLDLARPAAETIALLGGADRVALEPSALEPAAGRARVYGLVFRVDGGAAQPVPADAFGTFAADGYLKVVWDVQVSGDGERGSYVTTTTRFMATDDSARERLRSAWRVLGPISADLARRALASIKRAAENVGEPITYGTLSGFPAPPARTALTRTALTRAALSRVA